MLQILIADDEEIERKYLASLFAKHSDTCKVIGEASNGREVLELTAKNRPDVIIMDINMPGLDGLASAQRIKQHFPDTIILLNTAYAEFEFARKAVEYRLDAYLLKPAKEEIILQTIDSCIRNKARIKDSSNTISIFSVSKDSITLVTEYIDNNFNLPLTLDSLAEIAHFTPSYLSRIFHEKTGFTIKEYITKKRIDKAEYLLIYTEAGIQEISSRCGFLSIAHFHRIFKQKTGTTPLEYRHKHT